MRLEFSVLFMCCSSQADVRLFSSNGPFSVVDLSIWSFCSCEELENLTVVDTVGLHVGVLRMSFISRLLVACICKYLAVGRGRLLDHNRKIGVLVTGPQLSVRHVSGNVMQSVDQACYGTSSASH